MRQHWSFAVRGPALIPTAFAPSGKSVAKQKTSKVAIQSEWQAPERVSPTGARLNNTARMSIAEDHPYEGFQRGVEASGIDYVNRSRAARAEGSEARGTCHEREKKTEWAEAEAALRRENEDLRAMVLQMQEVIFGAGADGVKPASEPKVPAGQGAATSNRVKLESLG
jgi:hypothetical protein